MKTNLSSTFKAIVLSYSSVPIEVRSQLIFDYTSSRYLLRQLSCQLGLKNLLIVSTTSSLEIYYHSPIDQSYFIINALFKQKQLISLASNNEVIYEKLETVLLDSNEAVQHLYRVSAGLEASCPGDIGLYKGVKQAYERSAQEGVAGHALRRLMQSILLLRGIGWN